MGRRLLGLALGALAVFSVWWVQAPPRTDVAYRESAETTLEKLRSRTATAGLWVRQLDAGRVHRAATKIALEEAETGAVSALAEFEGYDPPAGLEHLRSDISSLGSEAEATLARLRIAADQDRWRALPGLSKDLARLSARFDELSQEAAP